MASQDVGRVVEAGTNDSGLFRFFDPLNWEILIKVLDGCRTNGRMWVLGASTTESGVPDPGHRHGDQRVAVVRERARPAGAGDR